MSPSGWFWRNRDLPLDTRNVCFRGNDEIGLGDRHGREADIQPKPVRLPLLASRHCLGGAGRSLASIVARRLTPVRAHKKIRKRPHEALPKLTKPPQTGFCQFWQCLMGRFEKICCWRWPLNETGQRRGRARRQVALSCRAPLSRRRVDGVFGPFSGDVGRSDDNRRQHVVV